MRVFSVFFWSSRIGLERRFFSMFDLVAGRPSLLPFSRGRVQLGGGWLVFRSKLGGIRRLDLRQLLGQRATTPHSFRHEIVAIGNIRRQEACVD